MHKESSSPNSASGTTNGASSDIDQSVTTISGLIAGGAPTVLESSTAKPYLSGHYGAVPPAGAASSGSADAPPAPQSATAKPGYTLPRFSLSSLASVKITIVTISLIAATILVGAWCPQESAVGQEKVIETFGEDMALKLIQWGIADIFHTPWFLGLIAVLTVNMVACSLQRVFPKVRLLKQQMPYLGAREIERLPCHENAACSCPAQKVMEYVHGKLKRQGYTVRWRGDNLTAEFGKFSKLAATITHIGLLTLLLGVTITSWTGFSGFKPVRLGEDLTFQDSEHSKLWAGKLPDWRVHVDATWREDYDTGEAKQWYSQLRVLDPAGHVLKKQEISVNNQLSFQGVDVYQSSWGLDQVLVRFNGHQHPLQLRPMGQRFAAFLPLDETTILIFSLKNQSQPLRLFAKRADWGAPRLLVELTQGTTTRLGEVEVRYDGTIPITGLQYKCDPGLPITYVAFAFIIAGVMLATVPHRLLWASVTEIQDGAQPLVVLSVGGRSAKARVGFERSVQKLMQSIRNDLAGAVDRTISEDSPGASERELSDSRNWQTDPGEHAAVRSTRSKVATLEGGDNV